MYNATRTCAHCGPRYVCIAAACKARAALQGCLGSFLKHRHVQTTHSKQASEKTLSGWTKGVKVTAAVQRSGLLHRTHWTHAPGRLAAGGRQAQAAKNAVFRQFQRRCAVHEVRTSVLSGLPAQREVHERPVEQQPAHQRGACATRARIHSSQALNINKSQPPARRRLSMLVAHAMSETATLMRAGPTTQSHIPCNQCFFMQASTSAASPHSATRHLYKAHVRPPTTAPQAKGAASRRPAAHR